MPLYARHARAVITLFAPQGACRHRSDDRGGDTPQRAFRHEERDDARDHTDHTEDDRSAHAAPLLLSTFGASRTETRDSTGTSPSLPGTSALKLLERFVGDAETRAALSADADGHRSHLSCQPHRADFTDGSGWNEIAGLGMPRWMLPHETRTLTDLSAAVIHQSGDHWPVAMSRASGSPFSSIVGPAAVELAIGASELRYSAKLSLKSAPGRRSRRRLTTSGPAIPS